MEAQAKEMFDGGVDLDVPFTTKINGDFVPSVNELKKPMPGGNMKTVGYRRDIQILPRTRPRKLVLTRRQAQASSQIRQTPHVPDARRGRWP